MRSTPSRRRIKPPKAEATVEQAEGDLHLWKWEVGRHGRDGPKICTRLIASWREDGNVWNVYLGSTRKTTREQAMQKARRIEVETLECTDGMP
jgi:hypothetical protein